MAHIGILRPSAAYIVREALCRQIGTSNQTVWSSVAQKVDLPPIFVRL